jgi:hypothetical protein
MKALKRSSKSVKKGDQMRKVVWSFLFLFLITFNAAAEPIGTTDEEVKDVAQPVIENIMEGFQNNDYLTYSKDFDDTLKESITEEQFYQTDQWHETNLGALQSLEYLGFLQQGQMTSVLWKAKFELTKNDVLVKLVMSRREYKDVVVGLWFQ